MRKSPFPRVSLSTYLLLCASVSLWLTFFTACSIPNLESSDCAAARDAVKRFYSFHFGNDMRPSPENLEARKGYLTPSLFRELSEMNESSQDYFTASENFPKAFRVGACREISADKVEMQVLLFWKDDTTSEQKELNVDVVKSGDTWLIDEVTSQ